MLGSAPAASAPWAERSGPLASGVSRRTPAAWPSATASGRLPVASSSARAVAGPTTATCVEAGRAARSITVRVRALVSTTQA